MSMGTTWAGSGAEWDMVLTFFGRIGAGLGFSVGPDRRRIVMTRDCQLKYAIMLCPEM